MNQNPNEIILAFIGEPSRPGSPCRANCHGYDAFVCADHDAVYKMFDSLCMWGGRTNTYIKGGHYYAYYELDCQLKEFFKSDIFSRLCRPYNVRITIIEDNKELYEKFYKDARTRY